MNKQPQADTHPTRNSKSRSAVRREIAALVQNEFAHQPATLICDDHKADILMELVIRHLEDNGWRRPTSVE